MAKYLLLALAILVLPSCVTSTASSIPGVAYDARPSDHPIEVYANEVPDKMSGVNHVREIPSGTENLGRVAVNGAEAASWNSVLSTAKSRARKMGGDAIVIESWGFTPVTGYATSGGITMPVTSAAKNFVARVVRYH